MPLRLHRLPLVLLHLCLLHHHLQPSMILFFHLHHLLR
jgi:hypothetical protein